MDSLRKFIGNQIRMQRKNANLSQEGLAEKLGTSQATVARWERGQFSPTLEFYELLRQTINVDITALDEEFNRLTIQQIEGDSRLKTVEGTIKKYLPELQDMFSAREEVVEAQREIIRLQKENQKLREIAYGKANAGDAYTEHMEAIEASDPQNPVAGQLEKVLEALKTAHPSHIDSIAAILDVREPRTTSKKKDEAG